MKSLFVDDLDIESVREERYDLAIFASGYESRCIHVASQISQKRVIDCLVLGFEGMSSSEQRKRNDNYFKSEWQSERLMLGSDDATPMFEWLRDRYAGRRKRLRIVVDYSSMSRIWYSGLMKWARLTSNVKAIEIDFAYAVGVYPKLAPIVVGDMLPIPGLEGGALRFSHSVAVVGLGFYGLMTQCVLEHLQPDIVYAYYASPGASREFTQRVRKENRFVIGAAKAVLEVPLNSVQSAARYLSEIVLPHLKDAEVVLVPMGPKPHVLAAIIVGMQFREVACLRVSATRSEPEDIPATGQTIVTRLRFA